MEQILRNYHTHTSRCKHAKGTDEEYVLAAIANGYDTLGFTDHSPWPFEHPFPTRNRMDLDRLEDYVASIRALRDKYRGRIRILLGLECEYYPQYFEWMKEQKRALELDYVLLGCHFARPDEVDCQFYNATKPEQLQCYEDLVLPAMESGEFAYLAHPDVALASYPVFDAHCERLSRRICEKALKLNMPLEYNLQGVHNSQDRGKFAGGLKYPCLEFWKIAGEMGCTGIIGVDAHMPEMLGWIGRIREGERILTNYGLKLTDQIRLDR